MDRTTLVLATAAGALLLGWLLSAVYAFAFAGGAPQARPLLAWQDPAAVAAGRTAYAANCANCHGMPGSRPAPVVASAPQVPASRPPAPPLGADGEAWKQPDFALFQLVASGASPVLCLTIDEQAMPRFAGTLTDAEIRDTLAFLKSTWPEALRKRQDEVNALYARENARLRVSLGGGR